MKGRDISINFLLLFIFTNFYWSVVDFTMLISDVQQSESVVYIIQYPLFLGCFLI